MTVYDIIMAIFGWVLFIIEFQIYFLSVSSKSKYQHIPEGNGDDEFLYLGLFYVNIG